MWKIMQDSIESLVKFLESYRGRDKVIRTLCYGSQLVGGVLSRKGAESSELGKRLLLFASQLSHCRTVLRLFDDLAMLAYTWSRGLGASEEDQGLRWMGVMNNATDQLYYPLEHVAWAADAQLINVRSDRWWMLSTIMWGMSLLLGILRSLRVLVLLRKKMKQNERAGHGRESEAGTEQNTKGQQQVHAEMLSMLCNMADLSNAIHWMPPGFLWAGHFPDWLVGLMGTTSSLIGLYQMYAGRSHGV